MVHSRLNSEWIDTAPSLTAYELTKSMAVGQTDFCCIYYKVREENR